MLHLRLPRGAQIEIEYNLRMPSMRAIVRQVRSLGYKVIVRPYQGKYWQDRNTFGSTPYQGVGSHTLNIYPPLLILNITRTKLQLNDSGK